MYFDEGDAEKFLIQPKNEWLFFLIWIFYLSDMLMW